MYIASPLAEHLPRRLFCSGCAAVWQRWQPWPRLRVVATGAGPGARWPVTPLGVVCDKKDCKLQQCTGARLVHAPCVDESCSTQLWKMTRLRPPLRLFPLQHPSAGRFRLVEHAAGETWFPRQVDTWRKRCNASQPLVDYKDARTRNLVMTSLVLPDRPCASSQSYSVSLATSRGCWQPKRQFRFALVMVRHMIIAGRAGAV